MYNIVYVSDVGIDGILGKIKGEDVVFYTFIYNNMLCGFNRDGKIVEIYGDIIVSDMYRDMEHINGYGKYRVLEDPMLYLLWGDFDYRNWNCK